MLENIFKGIFDTGLTDVISVWDFLFCIAGSLVAGFIIAILYTFRTRCTKSFAATLALLPAAVCVVIMMVNGNVGAGVAVAGAFSLVRFRSVPGSAREIGAVFLAMGAGIVCGMGYIAYGILFSVVLSAVSVVYGCFDFGAGKKSSLYKTLHITIPEDLDYTGVFEDLFDKYTSKYELVQVKTTNMGSLFRLTYNFTLRNAAQEKEFIDSLRCRNGNLEISVSKQETNVCEL